ncbi:MAG: tyrosine--tRNA ligase [Candidatus Aureabacteria bacterium]|nr:tyrosine--tRNA ligase [Candidatus Auribacterota bacterium]
MNTNEPYRQLMWGVETVLTPEDLKARILSSEKEKRPLIVKLGVDPTAPDIHLGHTVVLRKLRQFQDLGHQAVLIIGGFTSRIGDPSGKSKTRPALDDTEIKKNADTYLQQVEKILTKERLRIVDNREWLDSLSLKEVIKLLSHATLSKILEHNTFKERFRETSSIRMHEFIYPFLQAYDSIFLKSDIELGGTDQLFNIALGRELQKEYGQNPQCALLMPVLVGTDGVQKMSKSLGNYIGVSESPKVMAQKLLNMPDINIVPYFQLLTPVPEEEVKQIEKELSGKPATDIILKYKNRLIEEITGIYHPGANLHSVDIIEVPSVDCENGKLGIMKAISISGFAQSNREAFQYLQSNAVRVNQEVVKDKNHLIDLSKGPVQLNVGKKKFVSLEIRKS